jgi:RHS repeat-associated protein
MLRRAYLNYFYIKKLIKNTWLFKCGLSLFYTSFLNMFILLALLGFAIVNAGTKCTTSKTGATIWPSIGAAADRLCDHQNFITRISEITYGGGNSAQVTCDGMGTEEDPANHWSRNTVLGGTVICTGGEYYADASNLDLDDDGEGNSCPKSPNPINLITGNKFKIHTDVSGNIENSSLSRPQFIRTYNSHLMKQSGHNIGQNWRHSYNRSLQFQTIFRSGTNLALDTVGQQSDLLQSSATYITKQQACETGFNEIKLNITSSPTPFSSLYRLINGSAYWVVNRCIIRDARDYYITTIPIKSHTGYNDVSHYSPYKIKLARPDGNEYTFIQNTTSFIGATFIAEASGLKGVLKKITTNVPNYVSTYEYTDINDIIETYDDTGQLQTIQYPNGIIETLSYTGDQLDRVDNNIGKFIVFAYNPDGAIQSISDDTSRIWQYQYNAGRLSKVINPDTTEKNYHYEDTDITYALTGMTDERGIRYSTFSYHPDGNAKESYLGSSADKIEGVSVVYGATTNTVTDSRGNVTGYHYSTANDGVKSLLSQVDGPGCSGCGTGDSGFTYDLATHDLLSKTEFGIKTTYSNYDAKNNPQTIIEAEGTPEQITKTYAYDPNFYSKVSTITEPSVFAGSNKVTTNIYDAFGNVLTKTIDGFKPDGAAISRATTYEYNGPFNQISKIDGPRTDVNDVITFQYYADNATEGNNRARLKSVTGADGSFLTNNISYTPTGKINNEYRANNLFYAYNYYPGNDRLSLLFEYDASTSKSRFTNWTYLPTGEVETITRALGTTDESLLTLAYDDARRLTRITDGLGNHIEYILDSEGNVEKENIHDTSGFLWKTLTQTFDDYNRLDNFSEHSRAFNSDFNADGTLDKNTDGKGSVTDYSYDNLLRLTQAVQDQGGTDLATANALTQYGYDIQDNLTSVTDANGGVTTYIYDDLGDLVSQASPDTGTVQFTRDEAGNVATQTDAKGQLFSYSYDFYNRLITFDAPGTEDDASYGYDTCAQGYGRLCQVTGNNSTTHYRYNAFGDVVGFDQSIVTWSGYNQSDSSMNYSYDSAARLQTMTYPSGAVVTYGYDASGSISSVILDKDGVQTSLFNITKRFPFGDISQANYGNGQSYFGSVNNDYRPFIVSSSLQYTVLYYDANGNPAQMYHPQGQSLLNYDAHDRLNTMTGGLGSFDYDYDPVGNQSQYIQDGVTTTMVYDANSNRMNSLNGNAVVMDENGNTTQLRGMTLAYTTDNRLKKVNRDAAFEYNGMGQRTRKLTTAPGVAGSFGYSSSVVYLYGLNGELLSELGPTGKVVKEYIYREGKPLVMLEHKASSGENFLNADLDHDGSISIEDFLIYNFNHGPSSDPAYDVNGDGVKNSIDTQIVATCGTNPGSCEAASYSTSIYYIHNDHLGTPKLLTNSSGQAVWRATADPFGQASVNEDVDGDGVSVVFNLRQPGQYYDGESGLYYNYFRYYDPETGRYITSDPIGLAGRVNTYTYVLNNPLKYVDPTGLIISTHIGANTRGMSSRDAINAGGMGNAALGVGVTSSAVGIVTGGGALSASSKVTAVVAKKTGLSKPAATLLRSLIQGMINGPQHPSTKPPEPPTMPMPAKPTKMCPKK